MNNIKGILFLSINPLNVAYSGFLFRLFPLSIGKHFVILGTLALLNILDRISI